MQETASWWDYVWSTDHIDLECKLVELRQQHLQFVCSQSEVAGWHDESGHEHNVKALENKPDFACVVSSLLLHLLFSIFCCNGKL